LLALNARIVLGVALLVPTGAGGAARAQGNAKVVAPPKVAIEKQGPERAVLRNYEGVWDATVEISKGPGAPTAVLAGIETNRLVGGTWLVSDFKTEMMGQPFQGHGIAGFDRHRNKYVSVWLDTMSAGLSLGESTYEPATKAMSGWMEGLDHTGKLTRVKVVSIETHTNTRTVAIYSKGADQKEYRTVRISYKRRQ
jgi:hypothetical protein